MHILPHDKPLWGNSMLTFHAHDIRMLFKEHLIIDVLQAL